MQKGFSIVIASILMMLIVFSLTGMLYLYLSGIFTATTSTFSVIDVSGSSSTIANQASKTINGISAALNGIEIPAYLECPSNVIFSDDFEDGNANGWNVVNGNWYVSSNNYKGDSIVSGAAESFTNLNFNQSTAQFQFKIGDSRPIDVMLLMDRSSSMSGQKISDAKVAAKTFVNQSNPSRDTSGLVSFNETATLDQSLTFDQAAVKNKIDSLAATDSTNIGDAIYNSTNELRHNGRPGSAWVEILLTDGQPNKPIDVSHGLQYALNASLNASSYGIIIYTIGLGSDANATLLQQIASNTNGKYYFAPDSTTLIQIYKQIAGEIFSGFTGMILKRDNTNLAKISASDIADRVDITDNSGTVVGTGYFPIENNTFYTTKVVSSGSKIFVTINGVDVASGDIGDSGPKNKLSLFSSQTLAVFDNIIVTDNSFYPLSRCVVNLFNFTKTPGNYIVKLRSPDAVQTIMVTVT
jgi:Mg-chelatase subunit ChlD